jgi:hypothetical protein
VLRRLDAAVISVDARTVAAAWALGVTLLGTLPLVAAAPNRSADPLPARTASSPVADSPVADSPAPALNIRAAQ